MKENKKIGDINSTNSAILASHISNRMIRLLLNNYQPVDLILVILNETAVRSSLIDDSPPVFNEPVRQTQT